MTAAETATRVLASVPSVELAVLFGSTARGTARAGSDLDIGVSGGLDVAALPALQVALERATGQEVSITLLDTAPPLLRFQIARDGIVLVERPPHAWARFRAQAMIDWWDWAPTAEMMHRTMSRRLREEAQRGPG
jgi:predicted nucleotidyltransferase